MSCGFIRLDEEFSSRSFPALHQQVDYLPSQAYKIAQNTNWLLEIPIVLRRWWISTSVRCCYELYEEWTG